MHPTTASLGCPHRPSSSQHPASQHPPVLLELLNSVLLPLEAVRAPRRPRRRQQLEVGVGEVALVQDLTRRGGVCRSSRGEGHERGSSRQAAMQKGRAVCSGAGRPSEIKVVWVRRCAALRTRRNSCPTAPVTPTMATLGPSAVFLANTCTATVQQGQAALALQRRVRRRRAAAGTVAAAGYALATHILGCR